MGVVMELAPALAPALALGLGMVLEMVLDLGMAMAPDYDLGSASPHSCRLASCLQGNNLNSKALNLHLQTNLATCCHHP